MTEYHESFGEDVGGKLLLFASLLAVFGVVALILMPLGAAFAPPPSPPAAHATATPDAAATATAPPAAPSEGTTATTPAAPTPAAAAPAGPPAIVGALMPGIIMLVVAAVLGVIAGLFLGHAKARSEAAHTPQATPPH